jgi:hypothetical protein
MAAMTVEFEKSFYKSQESAKIATVIQAI